MNFPVFSQLSRELGLKDAGSAASHQHATQIAAPESETRPHPPRCVPGRSNRGFISGDAMAEAFRRAGSARKTPGQR